MIKSTNEHRVVCCPILPNKRFKREQLQQESINVLVLCFGWYYGWIDDISVNGSSICASTPVQWNIHKIRKGQKIYWGEKSEMIKGWMRIRIPHTFSANNTTIPAFILFFVLRRSFPATFSFMVSARGLTVAGYAVPHEHASSRGSFEHFINAFDSQSWTLFICSGTNCVSDLFPSFPSNPRTRVIRGIGVRSWWS
jgi:hypothetical protein